jgi:hypothetical protein
MFSRRGWQHQSTVNIYTPPFNEYHRMSHYWPQHALGSCTLVFHLIWAMIQNKYKQQISGMTDSSRCTKCMPSMITWPEALWIFIYWAILKAVYAMAVNDIMEIPQRVDKYKVICNTPEASECIIVFSEICSVL